MFDAILFDLDGTLLPMDLETFVSAYFGRLAQKLVPYGYEPKALIDGVWAGIAEMTENDGSRTNAEAFWAKFSELFGERVLRDIAIFDEFYRNEFNEAKAACGYNPRAGALITALKEAGGRLILASNPVFPLVAQQNRLIWAGVDPQAFGYFTHYENSHFCKPNRRYYEEIAEVCNLDPGRCLMIGNDVREDGAARQCGMEVFLLTDCLINPDHRDISGFPHGGFGELEHFLMRRGATR